jgi:glycosyltransferase involved in cell wall biosynthesis
MLQAATIRTTRAVLPGFFTSRMGWEAYQQAAALVAPTNVEKQLMVRLFGADPRKVHIVPNGVEECFFYRHEPGDREALLVCTATITERKRVLELAEAAVLAATPVRIVGKPYSEQDPYYRAFAAVARKHPDLVLYHGPINDRKELARLYQRSAGFVLLSTMESLSLSSMEAAASGCKLLLADLPWAHDTFGTKAWYCPVPATVERTAQALKNFVRNLSEAPNPPVPFTWNEIGLQFARIYESALLN